MRLWHACDALVPETPQTHKTHIHQPSPKRQHPSPPTGHCGRCNVARSLIFLSWRSSAGRINADYLRDRLQGAQRAIKCSSLGVLTRIVPKMLGFHSACVCIPKRSDLKHTFLDEGACYRWDCEFLCWFGCQCLPIWFAICRGHSGLLAWALGSPKKEFPGPRVPRAQKVKNKSKMSLISSRSRGLDSAFSFLAFLGPMAKAPRQPNFRYFGNGQPCRPPMLCAPSACKWLTIAHANAVCFFLSMLWLRLGR